ncbi:unnamed protein product [Ophioblennius macclurei]
MAKKGPSMKGFKKLFSRSEVNLSESLEKEKEKEKQEKEKKKFKFPTLKPRSKSGSEKSLNGSQQVLSVVEAGRHAEDGEVWVNDGVPKHKRSSLYGTAPRSKDKDISYSELDLRKPKRFATFSFGFKKKKKKDDDDISKSSFGLHTQGIEEHQEDLGQMKLDQTSTKRFSMSEPELDTSGAFDIPSPPPVAGNQPESYFTLTSGSRAPSGEILANGFDVHREPAKAPIAAIPEAQLDDPDPSYEKENDPNDFKSTVKIPEFRPEAKTQSAAELPPFPTASASARLPDGVDAGARSKTTESSPPYLDSKKNLAITDSPLSVNGAATDSDVSLPDTTSAVPEIAANATPAVNAASVNPEIVYGALYDSLFPQKFTAGVLSALSKTAAKTETVTAARQTSQELDAKDVVKDFEADSSRIYAEMTQPAAKRDIVMIKTFSERHAESVLRSEADRRTNGEAEAATAAAEEVDGEYRSDEIGKLVTVETLKEIHSESSGVRSLESSSLPTENLIAVDKAVESFVVLGEESSEESERASPPEGRKAVMVKTLYRLDAEAEPANAPPSKDSTDAFLPLDEEEADRDARKMPILIKTRDEIHTESCVVLSPKKKSGESDFNQLEETLGKFDLTQIERPENGKPVENHTDENSIVSDGVDGFRSIKEKPAETSSTQILTDIKVPEAEPEPVAVKTSQTSFSEKSDSVKTDDSAHTLTSISGKSANSPLILTVVRSAEIIRDPQDNGARRPQAPSEENQTKDPVEVPSVGKKWAETIEVVTETEKPDVVPTSDEFNTKKTFDHAESFDKTAIFPQLDQNPDLNEDSSPQQVNGDKGGGGIRIPQSEPSRPHSEGKPDSGSAPLPRDNAAATAAAPPPPPPNSDCATSSGTAARVTVAERRDVPVGDQTKTRTESLPGRMEEEELMTAAAVAEGCASPSYLSIGSEESANAEVYYSAEEGSESGDELFAADARGESGGGAGQTEVRIVEVRPERVEKEKEVKEEVEIRQAEVKQLVGRHDAESLPRKDATAAQIKEEEEEEKEEEEVEEEVREEELPATPVQQVKVCEVAPPGEGAEEARRSAVIPEADDPKVLLQLQENNNKGSTLSDTNTPLPPPSGEEEVEKEVEVGGGGESVAVKKSATTESSGAAEVVFAQQHNNNRPPPPPPSSSSEWACPPPPAADAAAVHVEATVELSEPDAADDQRQRRRPDAAAEAQQERPVTTRTTPPEGTTTTTTTTTAAAGSHPTETNSGAKMNSSYSSFSTKLSLRSSAPSREDESKLRVHKLSLINDDDADATDGGFVGRNAYTVDEPSGAVTVTETESSGGAEEASSGYRWKNRFEGVSQYVPQMMENSTLISRLTESSSSSYPYSSPYSSSSTSSSTLPEATAYKHLSEGPAPSLEEHSTFSSRLPADTAGAFLRRESEPEEEAAQPSWRRSYLLQELQGEGKGEEPAAPAPSRWQAESEERHSRWDSQPSPAFSSLSSFGRTEDHADGGGGGADDEDAFTGVFKATLVQLVPDPAPAPPSTPPGSPVNDDAEPASRSSDMESLVDTLKSMGPSVRPPRGAVLRPPVPALMSSLPPIVEDATSPVVGDVPDAAASPAKLTSPVKNPAEPLNGQYALPADLGLRRNARDLRSPLELMKQNQDPQQHPGTRNLSLHLRSSTTTNSISSDASNEALSPTQNGNGAVPPSPSSRLDNSVLFGSYRSSSIDQTAENGTSHRQLFRTGSLPDSGTAASSRMSAGAKELGEPRLTAAADPVGSRSERLSFLLNATVSSTGSLPGSDDLNSRISRPPSLGIGSPPAASSAAAAIIAASATSAAANTNNIPAARVLTSSSSLDLPRPPLTGADPPLSIFGQMPGLGSGTGTSVPPLLQRSMSSEGLVPTQTPLFSSLTNQFQNPAAQFQSQLSQFQNQGPQFQSQLSQFQNQGPPFQNQGPQFQNQEPDRNIVSKYRAFPDAYLTKEKEHGKLNPRPGKMYIFDRPGMCGQRLEIRSDIVDATSWELQETISIRVVRGGWVMYEKPDFKGEKIALDEGDIEITYPFGPPPEEQQQQQQQQQNGQQEAPQQQQNGEKGEEQSEAKPTRKFIIGSIRRAVRDYSVPDISLFPEENAEGKKVIFRDTSEDARIFGFPIKANSIIINAGLWLVYAQPFFQGVPRVLEVGGYSNPAAWGVEQPYVGSLHPLKVGEPRVENVSEPKIVIYDKPYFTGKSRTITATMRDFMTRMDRQQTAFMYSVGSLKVQGGIWVGYEKEGFRGNQYLLEEGEYHDWRVWGGTNSELRSVRVIRADLTDPLMVMFEQPEEDQEGMQEENTFEVTEAIPDVELFEYKTSTRSIHVLSGAWIAYSHVDFSGNQYILEKGFYNNCADWGSTDTRICSVQPILLAPGDSSKSRDEILMYSEPDFQGECHIFNLNQEALPDKLLTKSCRVARGSWVLYEDKQFAGTMYVLSEGDYPNLTSMGCPPGSSLRSIKVVPMLFSVPSISLFGLEGLEGREITTDTEIVNVLEEGFNNHILSVRVNSGCWVICEHSNYRGRQFLLEPIEVTNWPKFSSLNTVGSMYPVRPKRHFFRVKNKETQNYLSIQGGVEEMKSGRVVASPQVEPMSDIWYYEEGLMKNKLAANMALQVMGNVEPAAKVVLWTETRQPIQSWAAQTAGLITSLTFPGFVLDVKGGKTYDKDHVVIMPESDERPTQQWKVELL